MSKLIIFIIVVGLVVFLAPYLVLVGWNCARELWPELPVATYHHAFWITNAITILFKSVGSTARKENV